MSDPDGEAAVPDTVTGPLSLTRAGSAITPVVVADGEIDVATSPLLRSELAALLAQRPESVTLDLRRVTFIDSSGLGVLVGALKRLREAGGTAFVVVGAQDAVRKVFDITGLDKLFDLREA